MICFFAGGCRYPEHGLPALRIPDSIEGGGEASTVCQSALSDKKALSATLLETESKSRWLELEAREVVERATRAEAERDVVRHEVAMARLEIDAAGSAQAQMEYELARVQRALAASEDARWKVESELDMAQ